MSEPVGNLLLQASIAGNDQVMGILCPKIRDIYQLLKKADLVPPCPGSALHPRYHSSSPTSLPWFSSLSIETSAATDAAGQEGLKAMRFGLQAAAGKHNNLQVLQY